MPEIRIVLMDDGSIQAAVVEGSFEADAPILKALMADLGTNLPIKVEGEPEQHRHDPDARKGHHTAGG